MNKKVDSGDVAKVLDDTGLRLIFARDAIRFGRIPGHAADRLSKGRSDGARCAVCGMSLQKDELGCKLEYGQNGGDRASYYLHDQCLSAWESECGIVDIDGSASDGHGKTDDGPSAGNGHDPGRGKESP